MNGHNKLEVLALEGFSSIDYPTKEHLKDGLLGKTPEPYLQPEKASQKVKLIGPIHKLQSVQSCEYGVSLMSLSIGTTIGTEIIYLCS
jgi:hypothetical protein